MRSIRVTAYWGGYQEMNEVLVVGPYDNGLAVQADLIRFYALDEAHGNAAFEASRLDPAGADYSVTPDQVAHVQSLWELSSALYGTTFHRDE